MTELSQFSHSIDIAAPPRVVFTFLTTEEGMTAWMGQFAELDPRQGGRFAVDISGYPVRGQYLHVEPFSRVVVSWGFAGSDDLPPGASTVEFRLIEIEGGTRVELTHSDLPDSEVPGHAEGWRHFVPRLHEAAEGGHPGAHGVDEGSDQQEVEVLHRAFPSTEDRVPGSQPSRVSVA